MKTCNKCKNKQSKAGFTKNRSMKDGLSNYCRECTRASNRSYYQRNKNLCKARNKKWWEERREEIRRRLWEFKLRNPCVDCGECDPRVLQFDHVRGNKTCDVSALAYSRKASWDRIEKEIKKCVVRCANCHARRTWNRAGYFEPSGVVTDHRRRFSAEQVREIRRKHETKEMGMTLLARYYDVSPGTIWNLIHRRTYSDVE